jgi:hypothetical protein
VPLNQEELTPAQKIYNSVEKVVIVKGILPTDPTIWEFHINAQILRINTEKLETQTKFRQEYLKTFDVPAPKLSGNSWINLLQALSDDKKEYYRDPEDSENVYIAKRIFEKICELPLVEKDVAASGRGLCAHEGYYCLVSSKVEEIVKSCDFRIAWNTLSSTMSALGLKREGTETVRLGKKSAKCWWFETSEIKKIQEDKKVYTDVPDMYIAVTT